MEYFYGLLNDENTTHWTLINQIILRSKKGDSFYYPDVLETHPFDEGTLTLNRDTLLADIITDIFKKIPPHKIILLKVNDDPLESKAFTAFKQSRDNRNIPSFFTHTEKETIATVTTILRLTESQKIMFQKACISKKLRLNSLYQSTLTALLKPFINKKITNKSERSSVFNELINDLKT